MPEKLDELTEEIYNALASLEATDPAQHDVLEPLVEQLIKERDDLKLIAWALANHHTNGDAPILPELYYKDGWWHLAWGADLPRDVLVCSSEHVHLLEGHMQIIRTAHAEWQKDKEEGR
jgi:hypothetical protein